MMKRWIRALRYAVPAARKPGAHIHVCPCDACVAPMPGPACLVQKPMVFAQEARHLRRRGTSCAWRTTMPIPFSVLDLSPIVEGGTAADALKNTLDLARHAESLGFRRY